jgi:hypothetical protein
MSQYAGSPSRADPIPTPKSHLSYGADRANSSDGLDAWRVSEIHYPFYGNATEKLEFCVRYAILARHRTIASRGGSYWAATKSIFMRIALADCRGSISQQS